MWSRTTYSDARVTKALRDCRVLVVGGAGYVGSHVVRALRTRNIAVVVLDDLSTGHRELVPDDVEFHCDSVEHSVRVRELLSAARIDAVMHFAAKSLVPESEANPRLYYEANLRGALALAGAMLDVGVHYLVFSSTAAIFGASTGDGVADTAHRDPKNPYGVTKKLIEDLLADYERLGLCSVSLRYFNAAGADPAGVIGEWHDNETHLIPIVLDAALGLRPAITVFGADYPTRDGTCVRDYVHVSDLARAHLSALDYLVCGGVTARVNLGSGHGITVREVIAAVERVTGLRVPTEIGPRRAGDPTILVASPKLAEALIGWCAERSDIDTIVADAWRWHKHHRTSSGRNVRVLSES